MREREAALRDPEADWRDQPWTSEAWRRLTPRERGYERQGRSTRARQTFDIGRYRPPPGVRMRTWSFGERLPEALRTPSAVISDPQQFTLPAPPPDRVWVRVATDALLVEPDGTIERIVYGLFR